MAIKKRNISNVNEVRKLVHAGITEMNDLVSLTLGNNGKTIIIDRGAGEPLLVDDGRRVAENIKLDDEIKQMAVRVAYGVTRKTDEKVGDGTTTAMVLTWAILDHVYKNLLPYEGMGTATMSVSEIDRLLHEALDEVVAGIRAEATQIESEQQLIDVATAVSNDPKIGETIGKMYQELGKNGHITLEFNLESEEILSEVVPGMRFTASYAESWMVSDEVRKVCNFKDTHVLVVHRKDLMTSEVSDLVGLLQLEGKSTLVIICPRFTDDFLKAVYATVIASKQAKRPFRILCVRFPGGHSEHYKDIAVFTGAKLFTDKETLEGVSTEDLGYVQEIECTDDSTNLVQGGGDPEAIKQRIEEVKAEEGQQKVHSLKAMRSERASALGVGVGVIKIGAPTDEERNWLKHKIEDAKYATKAAFREGVVPGGGMTFKKISEGLPEGNILKEAILAPYNTLKRNAGGVDFTVPADVVDAAAVEIAALTNAVSAAGKLLRLGGAIAMVMPSMVEALKGAINNDDDE
jgi:chaperonin GroEL